MTAHPLIAQRHCADLTVLAAYAKSTGKPISITEFCEAYNDGNITTKMASWAAANNVALIGWWDSAFDAPTTATGTCHLNDNPNTLAAWVATFGQHSYKGNFFITVPFGPGVKPEMGL